MTSEFGDCEWGGVKEAGFPQELASWVFFAKKSVIARESLLEIDTLLSIAM